MKKFTTTVAVTILFVLASSPVFAQDKTTFSITPRAWFAYFDQPFEDYGSYENFSLPMYGATLAVSPAATPNVNFLLTVLTGSGDGDGLFIWNEPATVDADRTDVELLARYLIPNTSFSVYGGLRYVDYESKEKGTDVYQVMEGVLDVYKTDIQTDLWVAEIGLGATANITESGRHRFFSNFTFGVAFSDWDWKDNEGSSTTGDDTSPMIDFNAGYQYTINERFSFSVRYRLFTIYQDTSIIDVDTQTKLVTIHGPELSLTATF